MKVYLNLLLRVKVEYNGPQKKEMRFCMMKQTLIANAEER
jgi:hypothetical protein